MRGTDCECVGGLTTAGVWVAILGCIGGCGDFYAVREVGFGAGECRAQVCCALKVAEEVKLFGPVAGIRWGVWNKKNIRPSKKIST